MPPPRCATSKVSSTHTLGMSPPAGGVLDQRRQPADQYRARLPLFDRSSPARNPSWRRRSDSEAIAPATTWHAPTQRATSPGRRRCGNNDPELDRRLGEQRERLLDTELGPIEQSRYANGNRYAVRRRRRGRARTWRSASTCRRRPTPNTTSGGALVPGRVISRADGPRTTGRRRDSTLITPGVAFEHRQLLHVRPMKPFSTSTTQRLQHALDRVLCPRLVDRGSRMCILVAAATRRRAWCPGVRSDRLVA